MADEQEPVGWEVILKRTVAVEGSESREVLGRRDPRRCAFCLQGEPAVSFKDEAHVIPIAIGNRELTSWEECDDCNAEGSKLEGDLVSVFALARFIGDVRPRKSKFKIRRNMQTSSYASFDAKARSMKIFIPDLTDQTLRVRRRRHGQDITIALPPYRPALVAKALARIAWFVMSPDRRARADHIRRWIIGEETWKRPVLHLGDINIPSPAPGTLLEIYGRTPDAEWTSPILDVRLHLGRSFLITHLPSETWELPQVELPVPAKRMEYGEDEFDGGLEHRFFMYSPEMAARPPLSHEDIAVAAYYRSLARGGQSGDAASDWLEAEQDLWFMQDGFEPHERPPS